MHQNTHGEEQPYSNRTKGDFPEDENSQIKNMTNDLHHVIKKNIPLK